jgi:hypothetical protein
LFIICYSNSYSQSHNSAQVATHYNITLVATYNLVGRDGGFAELHHGIKHLEGARKWRSAHNLVGGNETIGALLREFGDQEAFKTDHGPLPHTESGFSSLRLFAHSHFPNSHSTTIKRAGLCTDGDRHL